MLPLGKNISVRLLHVGRERQPLMIVDDVLAHPQQMIDEACTADWYAPEHTHYPGRNARLPDAYYQTVIAALRGPIEAAFGLSREAYLKYFGFFALATTPVEHAQTVQKIPHHDSFNPNRLAMVHYLCRGAFGGTGFFRHKCTGFESVDSARDVTFAQCAQEELREMSADAPYINGDSPHYALIERMDMQFNRLIVYRSHVLHVALLGSEVLSPDPRLGRLTANGFLEAAVQ
jgi:hypothetical protein